jgi:hypothetical protein
MTRLNDQWKIFLQVDKLSLGIPEKVGCHFVFILEACAVGQLNFFFYLIFLTNQANHE